MFDMVVCALIHRYPLLVAVGRRALLERPLALAPPPGGVQAIGEVSGAAEASGIEPGMSLAEATSRCPSLLLVPPDPGRAERSWECVLRRLEEFGATVESARPGEAFFEEAGLRRMLGNGSGEEARHRVIGEARSALGHPARFGLGPNRFCAYAAARSARGKRRLVCVRNGEVARFLAPQGIGLLLDRIATPTSRRDRIAEAIGLIDELRRLGIATLGDLASLPAAVIADRFGTLGIEARDLARGIDGPLRPRIPRPGIVARIELPDTASGPQLERALEILVDRILADPIRGGRSFRTIAIEATTAGGGSLRIDAVLRSANSDRERILIALRPKLRAIATPISALALEAGALGPPAATQDALIASEPARRRERIAEAVRQVQSAAGGDAMLRVLEIDPASRIPERRSLLTPFVPPTGDTTR